MECTVHLLAGMPVCYICRQQEGLTERTPAWTTSRRLTDEVRSSLHSRSASTTRSFRLANTEPDAIVAYFSSLEGSREERAFELAKNEYLAWLEHRTDRYTTVYGYMD